MQNVIAESQLGQFRLGNRERHSIIAFCSIVVVGLVGLAMFRGGASDADAVEPIRAEQLQPADDAASGQQGDDDQGPDGTAEVFGVQVTAPTTTAVQSVEPQVTQPTSTTTAAPATRPPAPKPQPEPEPEPEPKPDPEPTITLPDPEPKPIPLPVPTITLPTITLPTVPPETAPTESKPEDGNPSDTRPDNGKGKGKDNNDDDDDERDDGDD